MRSVEWEYECNDGTFTMSERHMFTDGYTACGTGLPLYGATIIYTQEYPTCNACVTKVDGLLTGTGMRDWHDVYNYTILSGRVNPIMIGMAEEIYATAGPFAALSFLNPHTLHDGAPVIHRVGCRKGGARRAK